MLTRCIIAENRKLHGSVIWLAFFIIPIFPAIMGTFNYTQNLDILKQGWFDLWTQHTLFYALFFFGPIVGLYAAYLWRLEHLGHNWNMILSAPVHPMYLFFAKFVVVAKMAVLTQLWVFVLFGICGHFFAHLPGFPPLQTLLWLLRGSLGGIAVIVLQLLLAMVIRSFAAPVLIALAGGVAGMAFISQGHGLLFPYSLMMVGMNSNRAEDVMTGQVPLFLLSILIFSVIFLAISHVFLTKHDVHA
ncbi:MAG: ABC transporter permease [Eubacteriales bacterium]|nr:ABC transporter permease [Eubacteriales bacterium]